MQHSTVREKLKARQPDVYVDVEVDAFYVLDFYRFRDILAAAEGAKERLRRQMLRVLSSQTAETLPAAAAPEPAPPPRKRRLPRLERLGRSRQP
jgi:NTE family protein